MTLEALTEAERAALEAVKAGPLAWSRFPDLEAAGHSAETMLALYEAGLAEPWERPGEPVAWTLSPLGAEWLGVELQERPWPLRLPKGVDVDALDLLPTERPYWAPALPRDVRMPRRPIRMLREPNAPTRLPHEGRMLVDPAPSAHEVLIDEWSGKPLLLFAGQNGKGGTPVVIDPRLGSMRRRVVRKRGRSKEAQAAARERKRREREAGSKTHGLTPSQIIAQRYEDWRVDHDEGRRDPATGRVVRRPVWLIADLAGVPERTVRHGIAQARRVRGDMRQDPTFPSDTVPSPTPP